MSTFFLQALRGPRICFEEEEGSSEGAYQKGFRYYIYILLDEYFNSESDRGQRIIKAFRNLDKGTKTHFVFRYPYNGRERNFRSEVLDSLGNALNDRVAQSSAFAVLLNCRVEHFNPKRHDLGYIDIQRQFFADGEVDDFDLHRCLKALGKIMDDNEDVFEYMKTAARNEVSWLDAVEAKPSIWGFGVDLKKLFQNLGAL